MNKKFIIMSLISVILVSIGTTYAYFYARVEGSATNVSVGTADIKVYFNDTAAVSVSGMEPTDEITKTFTIQNPNSNTYAYSLYFGELINTFTTTGNLVYQITSTNSGYNMNSWTDLPKSLSTTDVGISSNIQIAGNTTQTYTLKIKLIDDGTNQLDDMNKSFSFKIKVTTNSVTLYNQMLTDNTDRTSTRTVFTSYTSSNTGKIFTENGKYTEDLNNDGIGERVYYFAGNAQNNWVYFAGFYWRIIRTNEDGSIRLLYVGPDSSTLSYIGSSTWYNSSSGTYTSAPWTVGWMYKIDDSSTLDNRGRNLTSSNLVNSSVKTFTDNWYKTYINDLNDLTGNSYDNYVSKTAIYCSDRAGGTITLDTDSFTGAYQRINTYSRPSYKCGNSSNGTLYESSQSLADKYSVSNTYGNGLLTYPVGLMTVDEIYYAGGTWNNYTEDIWYGRSDSGASLTSFWLMTPYAFVNSNNVPQMYYIYNNSNPNILGNTGVNETFGIRPVISLKSCVTWTSGNGSSTNPYIISVNSTCAAANN